MQLFSLIIFYFLVFPLKLSRHHFVVRPTDANCSVAFTSCNRNILCNFLVKAKLHRFKLLYIGSSCQQPNNHYLLIMPRAVALVNQKQYAHCHLFSWRSYFVEHYYRFDQKKEKKVAMDWWRLKTT